MDAADDGRGTCEVLAEGSKVRGVRGSRVGSKVLRKVRRKVRTPFLRTFPRTFAPSLEPSNQLPNLRTLEPSNPWKIHLLNTVASNLEAREAGMSLSLIHI